MRLFKQIVMQMFGRSSCSSSVRKMRAAPHENFSHDVTLNSDKDQNERARLLAIAKQRANIPPNVPLTSEIVQDVIRTWRDNDERCVRILARCKTKEDAVKGFEEAAEILRQAREPMAQTFREAADTARGIPEGLVLRMKDDIIKALQKHSPDL